MALVTRSFLLYFLARYHDKKLDKLTIAHAGTLRRLRSEGRVLSSHPSAILFQMVRAMGVLTSSIGRGEPGCWCRCRVLQDVFFAVCGSHVGAAAGRCTQTYIFCYLGSMLAYSYRIEHTQPCFASSQMYVGWTSRCWDLIFAVDLG